MIVIIVAMRFICYLVRFCCYLLLLLLLAFLFHHRCRMVKSKLIVIIEKCKTKRRQSHSDYGVDITHDSPESILLNRRVDRLGH